MHLRRNVRNITKYFAAFGNHREEQECKKISNLPFQGTPEQEKKLHEVIEKHKDDKGAIMPVLQEAQEIYGYLPVEVQTMVAEGLNKPLEEVFGVATFYSQFSLTPKGRYNISICLGTACYVKAQLQSWIR